MSDVLKCFEIRDEKDRIISLIWAHHAEVGMYGPTSFYRYDLLPGVGRIIASVLSGSRVIERLSEQLTPGTDNESGEKPQ